MSESQATSLYVISTPIGNLADMTTRGIMAIKTVDTLLCEDTRRTAKLLNHYEIKASMLTFADFNENKIFDQIVARMENGEVFGLVSDAGTPLVSDPGYKLLRAVIDKGLKIEVLPGASAVLTALVGSGMTPDKFLFLGFLSRKHSKRTKVLEAAKLFKNETDTTIIFYEAPTRIVKFLTELMNYFPNREVVVARELTKEHEEFISGSFEEVIEKLQLKKGKIKGEFTVLV
ncbi:16S rRNA (cytidine(1402)-2'-O)-methyltransferase [Candidatus Curtissbacteria bacterium]|nr:16S rRNA (cytidine(1402)-2'-O)-methyltransferase [Candidatus Curtissbacteria bacterium]